ncbi:hypothetical protein M9434_002867 [Picochlorum sp. BPE23]|nr:hypothetical protein M9434_002867 [Picochlorum sp. BPE23]KAI8104913.1 hypothetical protein M9435_000088 [Picochlorum sp. BPE23]|mmetsp:Transcript_11137/g.22263  ORF Transcript_11137/g.22263 Transcript_11137/m.22263 type:complete len:80 (+) Transcript_11137:32-271(+)
MQSSWYQHVLKDAEDVALVLALATLGWVSLWFCGLRHIAGIQEALGLKRPAKPLFSEMKPDIDRLKKEFHENLSSFKKQ